MTTMTTIRRGRALTASLLAIGLALPAGPVAPLIAGSVAAFSALAISLDAAEARGRVNRARVSTHHNRNVNRHVDRNVNRNVNRNVHRDVDIDVDWDHRHYHPYARGVAAGVAVGVTAAAIGSIAYSLPGGCETVVSGNIYYRNCSGVWYAPQYQGTQVVYVVVQGP